MSKLRQIICRIKDHDWVYGIEPCADEALGKYKDIWEVRNCQRCKKSQERKIYDGKQLVLDENRNLKQENSELKKELDELSKPKGKGVS